MKVLKKKLDTHESGESCHCAGGSGCRSRESDRLEGWPGRTVLNRG